MLKHINRVAVASCKVGQALDPHYHRIGRVGHTVGEHEWSGICHHVQIYYLSEISCTVASTYHSTVRESSTADKRIRHRATPAFVAGTTIRLSC
jgi:hypothetical protein